MHSSQYLKPRSPATFDGVLSPRHRSPGMSPRHHSSNPDLNADKLFLLEHMLSGASPGKGLGDVVTTHVVTIHMYSYI